MTKSKEKTSGTQNGFSLISNEKLLALYSAMLKCRMLQERAHALFKHSKFNGNGYAAAGQEAATVGVAIDLLPEDTVCAIPGDIIPLFIKGSPLKKLIAHRGDTINAFPDIAVQLKAATDAALANKTRENKRIVVALCNRECTGLSAWQGAMEFAGDNALPMLFVSRNTFSAETPAPDPQTKARGIPLKKRACGFPTINVDGNDAVAVYRVACEAIAHARKGDGPTLIECQSWMAGDGMVNGDPLLNMEQYLMRKSLFSEKLKRHVADGFRKKLDVACQAWTNS